MQPPPKMVQQPPERQQQAYLYHPAPRQTLQPRDHIMMAMGDWQRLLPAQSQLRSQAHRRAALQHTVHPKVQSPSSEVPRSLLWLILGPK